jgi:hypothetical protein
VLIRDDEIDVPSPAQRPVTAEACNRCQIARLLTEAVIVEPLDRRVLNRRRIEAFQAAAAGSHDARRLVFEPRLVGGHLPRLRRPRAAAELLQPLPAQSAVFMVVPHRHERPPRPGVLNIRIVQVGAIDRPVIFDGRRNMEVLDPFAVRVSDDVAEAAVVHALRSILRIPHDFVDEVAEVQHEIEPIGGRGALVLENHPPECVLRALVDVLTADERKFHRAIGIVGRRRDRAADTAAISALVSETEPVLAA